MRQNHGTRKVEHSQSLRFVPVRYASEKGSKIV